MITEEDRARICGDRLFSRNKVFATLTRDYTPSSLEYTLPAGTVVRLIISTKVNAYLIIGNLAVDDSFPYDAAELLE